MALVVLVSAKGAPGVTSLTVALAALTPGAAAADLDPDGGDLALRYRRPDGAPLDTDLGVLSLANALRRDQSGHRWLPPVREGSAGAGAAPGPARLADHLQVTGGGLDLLLGVSGPEQAAGLGPLWSPLARALSEAGRTVYADCGRAGPNAPTMPVLHQADAVIVVARPELEELAHLRERVRFLNASVPGRFAGRAQIGVVLVAPERDRAVAGRTEQLLHASGVGVPVLGTMAVDQRGAEALRGMNRSRLNRSTLIRSVRSLLPSVSLLAGTIPELALPVRTRQPAADRIPLPKRPVSTPPVVPVAPAPEPGDDLDLFAEPQTKVGAATPGLPEQLGSTEVTPRRQNSFFGDGPDLADDPDLLPLTVAPGVYSTKNPALQDFPEEQTEYPASTTQPGGRTAAGSPGFAGFAGFADATSTGQVHRPIESRHSGEELHHTRSRRAAFGRDTGSFATPERRRARRHVMPSEDSGTEERDTDSTGPSIGTWLQDNHTSTPSRPEHTAIPGPGTSWSLQTPWAGRAPWTPPAVDRSELLDDRANPSLPSDFVGPAAPVDPAAPVRPGDAGAPQLPSTDAHPTGTGWFPPDATKLPVPSGPGAQPVPWPEPVGPADDHHDRVEHIGSGTGADSAPTDPVAPTHPVPPPDQSPPTGWPAPTDQAPTAGSGPATGSVPAADPATATGATSATEPTTATEPPAATEPDGPAGPSTATTPTTGSAAVTDPLDPAFPVPPPDEQTPFANAGFGRRAPRDHWLDLAGPPDQTDPQLLADRDELSARAALLREIRDRARQGTDGSGTWAGHTGEQRIVVAHDRVSRGPWPDGTAADQRAPDENASPEDDHDDLGPGVGGPDSPGPDRDGPDHGGSGATALRPDHEPHDPYDPPADSGGIGGGPR